MARYMRVDEFDFHLPESQIAQHPPAQRGTSRLMVLDRASGETTIGHVSDLTAWLRAGDVLVLNDTRVFPARLLGRRLPGGGRLECLLVASHGADAWEALVHPGQRLKIGSRFVCEGEGGAIHGEIVGRSDYGRRTVQLRAEGFADVDAAIEAIGHMPLPPYIRRPDASEDRDRYQTVFGTHRGSVAAPTAGLHFTPDLLAQLRAIGVEIVTITLHVGYGTFKPVRVDTMEEHVVDPERYDGVQRRLQTRSIARRRKADAWSSSAPPARARSRARQPRMGASVRVPPPRRCTSALATASRSSTR